MELETLACQDVIKLSVGGRHMSTTREVLVQCDRSMLATCFGQPAWARGHMLDVQGRIMLDCEPYCFQQILSFLTHKLYEQPGKLAPQPVIQQESRADFETLVDYLQLKEYMALTVADFHFTKTIGMLLTQNGLVAKAFGSVKACLAAPSMQPGRLYYIRCCISQLMPNAWIFLGVTQLSEPKKNVELDVTSFGWSSFSQYSAGNWRTAEAESSFAAKWQEGDEVVFKVDLIEDVGVLSVWCARFPHLLSAKLSTTEKHPYFFHFGSACTGTVQLLAATKDDREHFE